MVFRSSPYLEYKFKSTFSFAHFSLSVHGTIGYVGVHIRAVGTYYEVSKICANIRRQLLAHSHHIALSTEINSHFRVMQSKLLIIIIVMIIIIINTTVILHIFINVW